MCLYVDYEAQVEFVKKYKKSPKKRVKVYKIVIVRDGILVTPVQGAKLKAGWFKADESKSSLLSFEDVENLNNDEIYNGIHAYRTKEDAECDTEPLYNSDDAILECEMVADDVTGVGEDQIVGNKMWVPAAEVKKVLSRLTFDKLKLGQKFTFVDSDTFGVKEKFMKVQECSGYDTALDLSDFTCVDVEDEFKEVKLVK